MGIATVNRVLNDSGKASASTRERVIAAARQLGARRLMPEVHRGLTRFDFVFARSQTPFFQRLELALKRQMQLLDRRIAVHWHDFDPADENKIAAFIKKPPHRRNGLIVVVHDTPLLREAVQSVIKQGVPVVTLMSDLSDVGSLHYAGINNLQAGRSAGYFLGRLCPGIAGTGGRVLVLSNDLSFRAHRDRSNGFLQALAQRFAHLDCLPVVQVHDDSDWAFAAVDSALRVENAAPLLGIYNSGAASQGIAAALHKHGHSAVWVGHELTDEHRSLLVSGQMDLIIDQDPDGQILSGMQHLLHANKWLDQTPQNRPTEFRLYCAENITHQAYLPAVE